MRLFILLFRHQVTHYTGQLAKDTSKHLKDLNNISTGSAGGVASQSEQRQWRLQRERLQEDFTNALNKFQAAQRQAAQKEKEVVKKSRNAGNKFILIDLKSYHYQIGTNWLHSYCHYFQHQSMK